MQINFPTKDLERIAHYLHCLAVGELLRSKNQTRKAMKLANMIAEQIKIQRNDWQDSHFQWTSGELEKLIKENKTIAQIAEIKGVIEEKVEKALRNFGLWENLDEEQKI